MDETNYTYISTHTRTHTERVKRDGGQDEVTSPCYVTSPIAPQPCNLQLPAYSNPMSGRSVQLSERVPRCARDEYFRCERKTGKQTARTRLSSRPVAFIFYSDRRRRRRGFHRKRKIRGGNKGRSRRGIKLVYRPVENDSSGFNIPLFFFSFFFFIRRRDNSARKQEKREGRRKRIVEETVIKKLMRRPNSSPPSPSFFLFHFILFFYDKRKPGLVYKSARRGVSEYSADPH